MSAVDDSVYNSSLFATFQLLTLTVQTTRRELPGHPASESLRPRP